jgi:hypothetical protein
LSGTLDAGKPYSGQVRLASFMIPPGSAGDVHISAALEIRPGISRPVVWACEQPQNSDGSITVQLAAEDAPGWRKGV